MISFIGNGANFSCVLDAKRKKKKFLEPTDSKKKEFSSGNRLDTQALYKSHSRKTNKKQQIKSAEEKLAENIEKLQRLSKSTTDVKIAEKLMERARTGRALADKINLKTKDSGTVFTEEDFKKFEEEYFCS